MGRGGGGWWKETTKTGIFLASRFTNIGKWFLSECRSGLVFEHVGHSEGKLVYLSIVYEVGKRCCSKSTAPVSGDHRIFTIGKWSFCGYKRAGIGSLQPHWHHQLLQWCHFEAWWMIQWSCLLQSFRYLGGSSPLPVILSDLLYRPIPHVFPLQCFYSTLR